MSVLTDRIADLINRLKTGSRAKLATVEVPATNLIERILEALKKEAFIVDFAKKGKKIKMFEVTLAYESNGAPKIQDAIRVSKPSRRMYIGVKEVTPVRQGYGRTIITTPKGIMSDVEARKERVGGEPLFKIW
jgi:small subunit ribosomal protein S8